MKSALLFIYVLLLAACSNVPNCKLADGLKPFPKCQRTPPEHVWNASGGVELPYTMAQPPGKPKAIVLIFPGWDSVTGDYASLTRVLVQHGYAVYGSENRSFIYGPAKLQSNAKDWHPWVEDVKAFAKFVKAKHPGVPVFWHGQSFGAVEVLAATAEAKGADSPAGIIVHSPAYAMMPKSRSFFRSLTYGSIAWVTIPHLKLMELNHFGLTTDSNWNCQWLQSDDRLRKGYKVRFLITSTDMGISARSASNSLTLPVLAMWGGADRLTLNGIESQRKDYDHYMRCELANGSAKQYYAPAGGHLLTEGNSKEAAIHAIIHWLDSQR